MKWEVSRARVALAFGLVALAACAKTEKEKLPVITTGGPHAVVAGQTITVTATTTNGSDDAYTFAASDPAVATVDEQGVVTGVAPGEAMVTVTGATTGAVADHPVVVVAPSDTSQVPYYDKWMMSAHADATSEPFNHWNADGEVPTTCARCHSSEGFVDYLGGDGSTPGVVDKPAPIQSVIRCQTCHNPAADALASVTFPSGVTIDGLGGEARCMTCHQGRSSGADVDKAIMAAGDHQRRRDQLEPELPEHPLLPGRRHAVRGAGQGRVPVRGPGLRRPLPSRRRVQHMHRVPRSALDQGALRPVRRVP